MPRIETIKLLLDEIEPGLFERLRAAACRDQAIQDGDPRGSLRPAHYAQALRAEADSVVSRAGDLAERLQTVAKLCVRKDRIR